MANLIVETVDEKEPVYLIGFSRGAAAMIWAAKLVTGKRKRPIDAMFLFDAVERAVGADCDVITNAVKVYRALRDPSHAELYEPTVNSAIKKTAKNIVTYTPDFDVPTIRSGVKTAAVVATDLHHKLGPSRIWFGNAGRSMTPDDGSSYVRTHFPCSHGAVGGTPWKNDKKDAEESAKVWPWMAGVMNKEGLFQIKVA